MKVKYSTYEMKYVNKHIFFGTGVIGVHRLKIYEKYGEGLPDCEICGKSLIWKGCHIDHIDRNPLNNDIENLRPLHHGCNTARHEPKVTRVGNKFTANTFPYEAMKKGFVSCEQAAGYCGKSQHYMNLLYSQNIEEFRRLLSIAADNRDLDPKAKRFSAKQRYDIAMYEDGFIRVQGWIKPEDEIAVKSFFHTKAGLDYESGEHLIKSGEKRAKKDDIG